MLSRLCFTLLIFCFISNGFGSVPDGFDLFAPQAIENRYKSLGNNIYTSDNAPFPFLDLPIHNSKARYRVVDQGCYGVLDPNSPLPATHLATGMLCPCIGIGLIGQKTILFHKDSAVDPYDVIRVAKSEFGNAISGLKGFMFSSKVSDQSWYSEIWKATGKACQTHESEFEDVKQIIMNGLGLTDATFKSVLWEQTRQEDPSMLMTDSCIIVNQKGHLFNTSLSAMGRYPGIDDTLLKPIKIEIIRKGQKYIYDDYNYDAISDNYSKFCKMLPADFPESKCKLAQFEMWYTRKHRSTFRYSVDLKYRNLKFFKNFDDDFLKQKKWL